MSLKTPLNLIVRRALYDEVFSIQIVKNSYIPWFFLSDPTMEAYMAYSTFYVTMIIR